MPTLRAVRLDGREPLAHPIVPHGEQPELDVQDHVRRDIGGGVVPGGEQVEYAAKVAARFEGC